VRAIEKMTEQQKVFSTTPSDEDVIAFARNNGDACVQVFFIRQGKLLGRENYVLEGTSEETPAQIMESFIAQFYEDAADIPPNLVLQHDPSEAEIIASWLKQKRGDNVTLVVPNTGEKRDLVDMVARNAVDCLDQIRMRWLSDEQKATAALSELQQALRLTAWPERIECYDISHTGGTNTVASMVVFVHGTAAKKEYRRFEIKTATNNDFAAMQEVLRRRFRRAGKERAEQADRPLNLEGQVIESRPGVDLALAEDAAERAAQQTEEVIATGEQPASREAAVLAATRNDATNWSGWAVLPDLVIIDGGKGQLNAGLEVMRELGLRDIPTVGLAKEREEIFLPGAATGLLLPREGEALHLVQRIRDEAHRFAVGYHRKLRGKRAFKSKLDDIPGVGPRRKAALIKHFGSVKRIREASIEELAAVPGMNRAAARQLKSLLE
jgi:excinuclease ABC subunit C